MVSDPGTPRTTRAAAWRFLIVGGSNTLATTVLLIALSYLMAGWLAYTIAFGAGLLYSAVLAGRWVFTTAGSSLGTALFALAYFAIYVVGLACVTVVHSLGWPEYLNALSVLVTAPLGFAAGRLIFRERQRQEITSE